MKIKLDDMEQKTYDLNMDIYTRANELLSERDDVIIQLPLDVVSERHYQFTRPKDLRFHVTGNLVVSEDIIRHVPQPHAQRIVDRIRESVERTASEDFQSIDAVKLSLAYPDPARFANFPGYPRNGVVEMDFVPKGNSGLWAKSYETVLDEGRMVAERMVGTGFLINDVLRDLHSDLVKKTDASIAKAVSRKETSDLFKSK